MFRTEKKIMKTQSAQLKCPTLQNYEEIFTSSEDVVDFANIISSTFPDYIRNKNFEASIISDRKTSNLNNLNFNCDDGSQFEKELASQISFLNTAKQTLDPYSNFDDINSDTKSLMKCESTTDNPNQSKFHKYVKVEVVDALVDSIIISTLLPLASSRKKNSKLLLDTIKEKKISSISRQIVESEKVQKLAQKRIFLLSIGKLRPTPEEAAKKKEMRFISASKLNLKSILKNPTSHETNTNINVSFASNTTNYHNRNSSHILANHKEDSAHNHLSQSNRTNKSDSINQNIKNVKRVHFVPEKDDVIPVNAVVFDYKEAARLMKKAREEEKAIRKREEEFMKKVKNDFMTKQKSTKNKHFTTTNSSAFDFNISLKPKPKPRSRSAKAKPKSKATNLSSSLYPSYYSPKTKSSTGVTHSNDKDDRIRKKIPIRSNSPQMSFRSQYDENSNVIRKGKSSGLSDKPKPKPKPRQAKSKPRTGYEY